MDICITKSVGVGRTLLSAFDRALLEAGVGNYNLIPLSSVIPPNSNIHYSKFPRPQDSYGHRLYVVMSRKLTATPGETVAAGIGWVQSPSSHKGLFVEIQGRTREDVERDIHLTLEDMTTARAVDYGEIRSVVSEIRCVDMPVCALVVAAYQVEGWK